METVQLTQNKITLRSAVGAVALATAPAAAGDGASLEELHSGSGAPYFLALHFDGSTSQTLAGVKVCVRDAIDEKWRVARSIATFTITATLGWTEKLQLLGAYSEIQVVGTLTGGGTVTVTAKSLEVVDGGNL